jgi:hypothetical protein
MSYITVNLDAPYGPQGANEAELVAPPKVGGDWLFNLNRDGALVQPDCTAPAGEDITSLSELTAQNFKRDVQVHLGIA